jgi:nucleotide-binding universal stress UspA family protein
MSVFHPQPQRLQHVTALCDLSPVAMQAAWRAALAARDLGVRVHLLYHCAQAGVVRVAESIGRLQDRAAQQLGVDITVERMDGGAIGKIVEQSRAGLLVVPTVRGNPIREFIMGTQAERILRLARGPVLVVKQPAHAPYRRVFVASDLQPDCELLVAASSCVAPRARHVLFHALAEDGDTTPATQDVAPGVFREMRLRRAARVRAALESLSRMPNAREGVTVAEIRPVVVVAQPADAITSSAHAARAELVVIGKRRRGLLADYFLGSVTQRVLASATSDVLVVPVAMTSPRHAGDVPAGTVPVAST